MSSQTRRWCSSSTNASLHSHHGLVKTQALWQASTPPSSSSHLVHGLLVDEAVVLGLGALLSLLALLDTLALLGHRKPLQLFIILRWNAYITCNQAGCGAMLHGSEHRSKKTAMTQTYDRA